MLLPRKQDLGSFVLEDPTDTSDAAASKHRWWNRCTMLTSTEPHQGREWRVQEPDTDTFQVPRRYRCSWYTSTIFQSLHLRQASSKQTTPFLAAGAWGRHGSFLALLWTLLSSLQLKRWTPQQLGKQSLSKHPRYGVFTWRVAVTLPFCPHSKKPWWKANRTDTLLPLLLWRSPWSTRSSGRWCLADLHH